MSTTFRDLKVWQIGIDLAEEIYKLTKSFPREEIYGMTSQLRRAAVSISSNIAEGNGRGTTKEYIHFLSISVGSLFELETQLHIAKRLSYIEQKDIDLLLPRIDELGRMLRGLQKSLQSKL